MCHYAITRKQHSLPKFKYIISVNKGFNYIYKIVGDMKNFSIAFIKFCFIHIIYICILCTLSTYVYYDKHILLYIQYSFRINVQYIMLLKNKLIKSPLPILIVI